MNRIPKQGEIYYLSEDRPSQIVSIAIHKETGESMVVYQALHGDFKTFVVPLAQFIKDTVKNQQEAPAADQTEASRRNSTVSEPALSERNRVPSGNSAVEIGNETKTEEKVNAILLSFLDATSYSKKLEVVSTNMKHLSDRLINDMAVALDCAVEEGPLDKRIQELLQCLQAMCRFEDRRLR